MRTLYNKFDKKDLAKLPIVVFDKKIVVINSVIEAEKAVEFLLKQPILGLDTETRPTFQRGNAHQVALLQVYAEDICFLFRLNHIDIPDCLVTLLSDTNITKVGLSLRDDISALKKRRDFTPGKFTELQQFVKEFGIQDMGLQKLYANVFQQKISKSQQLTNWEADILSDKQKRYAATDAWACVQLYNELNAIRQEGFELKIVEPEPKIEPVEKEASEASKNKLPREEKNISSRRRKKRASKKRRKTTKKETAIQS